MNKSPGGKFWAWKLPRFLRCSGILKSPCLKQKQTPHLERFGGMEMPKCPCSVSRGPKTGICLINSYCLLSSNQRVARSTHLKSELSAVNAVSWSKVVETTCKNTYRLRERALGVFFGWAVYECMLPLELTVAEHRVVLIVVFPARSKIMFITCSDVVHVIWVVPEFPKQHEDEPETSIQAFCEDEYKTMTPCSLRLWLWLQTSVFPFDRRDGP